MQMREDYYAGLEDRYFLEFEKAKEQKLVIDFDAVPPAPAPKKLGVTVIDDVSLQDVVPYIDWVSLLPLTSFAVNTLIYKLTNPSSHEIYTESILPNMGASRSLSQSWISQDL